MSISLLTLRDSFALAALPGSMTLEGSVDEIADYAYSVADAMLKARMAPLRSWPALQSDDTGPLEGMKTR